MKSTLRIVSLAAASLLFGLGASPMLRAQDDGQKTADPNTKVQVQVRPGGGAPGGGDFPGLGQLAPMMMNFGSFFGGLLDPSHSSALSLLQRNDVRSELLISAQQREALEDLQKKSQTELVDKMRTAAQESFKDIQNVPEDQRMERVQQGLEQIGNTLNTYRGDLDKRVLKLLNAKQTARLQELDLQWRGPMAVSETPVADRFALTMDQRGKAATALQDFAAAEQKAMMAAFADLRKQAQETAQKNIDASRANGNSGSKVVITNPNAGMGPQDLQKRMAEIMQDETLLKTRKEIEANLLKTWTPDQMAKWNDAQGRKFTFRVHND